MPNPPKNQRPARRFNGASSDPSVEDRLSAILTHLYGFYHTEIELSLDRTYRFLGRLGNPHLKLPRTVHVAGTNGKGSTTATLRALLEASGQSVHVYSSPHLVHVTERIRLAGEPISSEALIDVLTECIETNSGEPITVFEMFTCAAFLAFSRTHADWLILETGMGGRLDTTNVLAAPAATIITTISFDHQKFLGDTIAAIAGEKAGIMKAGVPCVVGHQMEGLRTPVLEVLHKASQALSPAAPLVREGAEWCAAPQADRMLFRYGDDSILTRSPALPGNHQYWNAGAALAAFRLIAPEHCTPEILSTGLANTEWPGRLQTLEMHPYNAFLPAGWNLVIDGGHNDSAGEVLAAHMAAWAETDAKPVHLVLAMVNRKDPAAFLRPLLPYVASLTATEIAGESTSFKAEELAGIARDMGFSNVAAAPDAEDALRHIAQKGQEKSRVLMTGSLFFMGNILAKA